MHEAVARAIRDAVPLAPPGDSLRANLPSDYDRAAAAAVRVCLASDEVSEAVAPLIQKARVEERARVLAEAQRAVEALRAKEFALAEDGRARRGLSSSHDAKARALGEALAVLAALAGDTA